MDQQPKWPLHVLLAEDTPEDVELFRIALSRAGTVRSLHATSDGEELLDYLQCKPPFELHPPPDIVFLDLKMPKTDGFDVLRWLKQHPDCAIIPTIMLSSSWLPEDVAHAYKLGANAFLTKPRFLADFVELLRVNFTYWTLCQRPEPVPVCRE